LNNPNLKRMSEQLTKNKVQAAMSAIEAVRPTLEPSDFSDIGQAKILIGQSGEWMRFSKATLWLVYNGKKWEESELEAQKIAQKLTEEQLIESRKCVTAASLMYALAKETGDALKESEAKQAVMKADAYHRFVIGRRKSSAISSTLTAAAPSLQVKVEDLDSDAFMLNVPTGTINLVTGELRQHDPHDLCTKICAASPSEEGKEFFSAFLEQITSGDKELENYLQQIAGMFSIGAVYRECLIIATGGGGNGKSTFFNLLAKVLGDYAGSMSSEVLTANCRKNKSPEYAELRGKRLVIAAELEEGTRLDTATVKRLCSTDDVQAEKKFRDPFSFKPSHSIVLFTNFLPKVGTSDDGTWSRLVVVPFNAKFRGTKEEILNYAEFLYEKAGGAVLSWMVEGASIFIRNRFKVEMPSCVKAAIDAYRADNDWLTTFLTECCVKTVNEQPSGELYEKYGAFCDYNGEYKRSATEFKKSMINAGYTYSRTKRGWVVHGLKVKPYGFSTTNEQTPWDFTAN